MESRLRRIAETFPNGTDADQDAVEFDKNQLIARECAHCLLELGLVGVIADPVCVADAKAMFCGVVGFDPRFDAAAGV
jgi:hypothetical protein